MLEEILLFISSLNSTWIYIFLFFFAFIENIFPPSPSDIILVVGASLIATTSIEFIPILLITSLGSALGFMLMYFIGYFLSERILRTGKIKFISQEALNKTDQWFSKYGYWVIFVNRFLPGIRSVISFFSGVHELNIPKTFLLSLLSGLLWNIIIIYMGMTLGNNIELIDYYLKTYSNIGMGIISVIIIIFVIRYYLKRKKINVHKDI